MLKSIKLACLALPFALYACSDEKANQPKEIYIVGTSADYPPFEFFKDSEIVGFDVDVIKAVAQKLGIKIEIKDMNFDGILGSLQSKRIDMAISALTPTPERQRAVDFTRTYYSTINVMLCNDQSPVNAVPDLAGLIVGVQAGSIYELYANNELKQNVDTIEVKSLPRVPDLVQELKSRRISCIIMGKTEAEGIDKSQDGLRILKIDVKETGFAIALPKGSPMTDKINQALKDLIDDGTIQKLSEKWLKQ